MNGMPRPKSLQERRAYGMRLDPSIMRDLQHLAVDQDRWVNDMVEEAMRDLLKKYREKRKEPR